MSDKKFSVGWEKEYLSERVKEAHTNHTKQVVISVKDLENVVTYLADYLELYKSIGRYIDESHGVYIDDFKEQEDE